MIIKIVEQVKIIEKYLAIHVDIDKNDKKNFQDIIKLLKKTYQVLPSGEIVPALSLDDIGTVLRNCHSKVHGKEQTSLVVSIKKLCFRAFNIWDMLDDQEGVQLILPISQYVDSKNGIGQCHGYIVQWAEDIKKESLIFGIIPFSTMDVANYVSDFEGTSFKHHAPITPEIINSQREQYQLWRVDVFIYFFKSRWNLELFKSANHLSDQCISLADNNQNKMIEISFTNHLIDGHSIGIIKTSDNFFHLLDANRGYYRFCDANIFKDWFTKYIHNYSYVFHGAEVYQPFAKLNRCQHIIYFLLATPIAIPMFICCLLLLLMVKVLMQPCQIYRAKQALFAESSQMYDEIIKTFNQKGKEINRAKLKEIPFEFADEKTIEMKEVSEQKTNYFMSVKKVVTKFFAPTETKIASKENVVVVIQMPAKSTLA